MIMTVSTFHTYMEGLLGEPICCEPSRYFPEMLRVLKPTLKRFKITQLKILRKWAPVGSIENIACYHFLVGEENLKNGIIEVQPAKKKR